MADTPLRVADTPLRVADTPLRVTDTLATQVDDSTEVTESIKNKSYTKLSYFALISIIMAVIIIFIGMNTWHRLRKTSTVSARHLP